MRRCRRWASAPGAARLVFFRYSLFCSGWMYATILILLYGTTSLQNFSSMHDIEVASFGLIDQDGGKDGKMSLFNLKKTHTSWGWAVPSSRQAYTSLAFSRSLFHWLNMVWICHFGLYILDPKKVWTQKNIGPKNDFPPKRKCYLHEKIWPKKILVQKYLFPKKFWVNKNFWSKKILGLNWD